MLNLIISFLGYYESGETRSVTVDASWIYRFDLFTDLRGN